MGRPWREQVEGGIFHVWARGNRRQVIFLSDRDRLDYLALLGRAVRRYEWHCLGYCLMDNHVHLLVETPKGNLAAGMHFLHSVYAKRFNERHGLDGHLFQGRYGSKLVVSDPQLVVTAAYIALNPVETGLCRRAEEWPWSSYAAITDAAVPGWLDADRLVRYFGGIAGGDGTEAFRSLVASNQASAAS